MTNALATLLGVVIGLSLVIAFFVITLDVSVTMYEPSFIPRLQLPWDGKMHTSIETRFGIIDIGYRK